MTTHSHIRHTHTHPHVCTHTHARGRKLTLSVACGWWRFSFKLILVTEKSDGYVSSLCLSEFTLPLSLGSQDFLSGFLFFFFFFNILIERNHF